ncbi:hypothetical protein [Bdellovibrio svalbardensis]|uniref:Histidine kinase N-terminal 7TM region domain-containing protein n=1 Tax=Bdellovibrio svalbardensis TaxID=2972972 RepID=A0ABT6DG74_9BACT|nr:hypothetical protein [Bdellovibrio svalbardensis]MDG0815477.1 hypothetical protein [Bdellovibrio svalbardensis]
MMNQNLQIFDACLSLLGALGIWPALRRLYRQESLNPLEIRMWGILASMLALFVVRFPLTAFDIRAFGGATYIAGIWLAFFVFLYFEGLLRKHMPFWLKLYMAVGSLIFIVDALANHLSGNRPHLIAFGIFMLGAQIFVALTALLRNRREHSRSENTLLDISILGLLLLGPLFLSDVTTYGLPHIPKLGALGGLLFTYFSLFNQALVKDRSFILRKLGKTLLFAAILLIPASLLFEDFNWDVGFRMYVFLVDVLLVFRIHSAVKFLNGDDDFFKYVHQFVDSEKFDLASLKNKISEVFAKTDIKILSAADLTGYDIPKIINLFSLHQTHLFNLEDIRQLLSDEAKKANLPREEVQIYEQIQHLLDENGMTYACLLSAKSGDLLLLHIPYVAYSQIVETKTALIRDYAKLLERTTTT